MRLKNYEIEAIKDSFTNIFKDGDIYLFGSRIDDTKKGGDIDLFIVPSYQLSAKQALSKKSKFRLELEEKLGEQKIDIVISYNKNRSIEKVALKEGIKLNTQEIKIEKYLNECNKHIKRIEDAYGNLKNIFPLSSKRYQSLTDDEVKNIDQYLFRFSKLQDTLGDKLFRIIIQDFVENIEQLTFIDILNRLEKIGIINDAQEWKTLREYRNNISHQYDDEPIEMAEAINNIFSQKDIIIKIYQKIKNYYMKKQE